MNNYEIEEKDEEEAELPEEESAEESESDDGELTYDDDGNVIIPEDEEPEDGEEPQEGDEEAEEEPDTEDGDEEEAAEEESKGEDAPDTESEKDAKIAELEAKLARITKNGKEALRKLGFEGDSENLIDGLETLAAETEGKTLEEYRRERKEAQETEEAKAFVRRQAYENMKKADLSELHAAYPETAELDDVEKMENFRRFAELRDAGLSVKEAYAAANPEAMRKSAADAGKKKSLAGTKAHMGSVVPRAAKGESTNMPPSEMKRWREELFPGKSKKEIIDLWKRANS